MSQVFVFTLLLLAADAPPPSTPAARHYDDPYEAYRDGAYAEAARLFLDAQLDRPKDPRLALNVGDAYYKQGEYALAQKAFQGAANAATAAKDAKLQQWATYNLGNSLVRQQKLEEAAKAYEEALRLGDDADAKYNLELTRRLLEERKKQEQQSQQDQGKKPEQSPETKQEQQSPSQATQPQDRPRANADQDGDGLEENKNANGRVDAGKTDPTKPDGAKPAQERAAAPKSTDDQTMSQTQAELLLQQLPDTRPKPPKNRRGGRTKPVDKDW